MSVFDIYQSKFLPYLLWGGDPITDAINDASATTPSDPEEVYSTGVDETDSFFFGERRSKLLGEEQSSVRVGIPAPLLQWMATRLNLSQRTAIRKAAVAVDRVLSQREISSTCTKCTSRGTTYDYDSSKMPFTLIQGPPGTGNISLDRLYMLLTNRTAVRKNVNSAGSLKYYSCKGVCRLF